MYLPEPFDRITIEPGKLAGKPCIRGMRIGVEHVLGYLAGYTSHAQLFADFPELEPEDLFQAVAYATAALRIHQPSGDYSPIYTSYLAEEAAFDKLFSPTENSPDEEK